jgi:hypothetical protein
MQLTKDLEEPSEDLIKLDGRNTAVFYLEKCESMLKISVKFGSNRRPTFLLLNTNNKGL